MKREHMKIEEFYVLPNGVTFITPDGIGGFWYDTLSEATEQHGKYATNFVMEITE